MTKSDWTLKYIQRQNPTRDDAERTKDNERHLCRDVPPPSGCRKKLKQMNGKKNLNQSGMLACVALQFALKQRGKIFFKKKQMAGQWAGKVQIKGIPSAQRTQKNVSHTPSTNLSPSKKKKPSTNL